MSILKIKNVGDEATLAIADVEVVEGDNGNQIKFETIGGDILYVTESAVMRQLVKCGVAEVADLAGQIIHFSRAANKNKSFAPYWNLSRATEADIKKAATVSGNGSSANVGRLPGEEHNSNPPDEAPTQDELKAALFAAHSRCFKHVCDKYVPYAAEKGVELSLEGVSALTAQLWIELNKRGIA